MSAFKAAEMTLKCCNEFNICFVALVGKSLHISSSLSCTGSSSWSELSSAKLISFSRADMTDLCLDITWRFIREFLLAL